MMSDLNVRVFISYTHDNDDHKQNVLDYSNWLNDPGGVDCWIDRYVEDTDLPEGWPAWMRKQIGAAKYVLVACTSRYFARFNRMTDEVGKGKGAKWESVLMENEIYFNEGLNPKFIPIIFTTADEQYIPTILQNATFYDLSRTDRRDALFRRLTGKVLHQKPMALTREDVENAQTVSEVGPRSIIENHFVELEKILTMKPGTKIMHQFFSLSPIRRFALADKLGLVEAGEELECCTDRTYAAFLQRAYERNLLASLWTELFNEKIDPNPF